MKISGFTMVRNATKYYFPVRESIESILPVVDEFIVALGEGDIGDSTREAIESIGSPKIRILDRVWREEDFAESRIFAIETNFALSQCTGDWCFYLQADEVIHENDLPVIRSCCEKHHGDVHIDGLLFDYYHFWGDYDHYLPFHGWYRNEIRIIRNNRGIYSYKDAQSFRKEGNQKLNVIKIPAHVYHYGWVRPPHLMQSKKKEHDSIHHGKVKAEAVYRLLPGEFDYGPLKRLPLFDGTHPAVMESFMSKLSWHEKLNYTTNQLPARPLHKHERNKYRILSWIENHLLGGRGIFDYRNWVLHK